MPSFMIHTISGEKMIKKLKLQEEDRIKFFISNLVPDTVDRKLYDKYKGEERRDKKQKIKRITHFRTDFTKLFEYPNLELYLSKYEQQTKEDINYLGYFFHLYTDYYYFSKYLSNIIVFYDKDHNISSKRNENRYVELKNYNREIDHETFWDTLGEESIYSDYSRLNKYLINKYPLSFNTKDLIEYLKKGKYKLDMEEINPRLAIKAIERLKQLIDESKYQKEEQLRIFTKDQIDKLMDETVTSFLKEYDYLLDKYR